MSSKASNGSPSSRVQPDIVMDSGDTPMRGLQHEESLGNKLLKSISPEWLMEHKDLLDLIANSPGNSSALEQAPGSTPMDVDSSMDPRLSLSERVPSQQSSQAPAVSQHTSLPVSSSRIIIDAQAILPGPSRELSPQAEVSQWRGRSSSLQIPMGSTSWGMGSRSERSLSSIGRHSEERRTSGLVPEVSLAARAGSLGATSLQTPYRLPSTVRKAMPFEGGQKALSESALQTSGEESELVKAEQEEEQPARKGPGRKKRTAPILVETEDGETKYVSPAEFRKLRRRITNRLSARRMRKKHAEERNVTQTATRTLEEERNYYKESCEQMRQQLEQMEMMCHRLQAENQSWKSRWSRLTAAPPQALYPSEVLSAPTRPTYSPQLQATPIEPPTPAYARPAMQINLPSSHAFDIDLQPNSVGSSLTSPLQGSQQGMGMPFIPPGPGQDHLDEANAFETGRSFVGAPVSTTRGEGQYHVGRPHLGQHFL